MQRVWIPASTTVMQGSGIPCDDGMPKFRGTGAAHIGVLVKGTGTMAAMEPKLDGASANRFHALVTTGNVFNADGNKGARGRSYVCGHSLASNVYSAL